MEHKFNYNWKLSDTTFTKDKGKVFSCFACGGGSTMGYKLAGFDVIGDNEIDPKMNEMYVANHHPRINYLCDIRELVTKAQNHELEDELYNLDILDASFPCSSFSSSGKREKDWGKEKVFREGQKAQVLDTLCFDTIQLIKELQPKIALFENVKGLITGKAKEYTDKIIEELYNVGYKCQYYLLNGKTMGLPQARERVFFIAINKEYAYKKSLIDEYDSIKINMAFNEPEIPYGDFADDEIRLDELKVGSKMREYWENRQYGDTSFGDIANRLYGKPSCFSNKLIYKDKVMPTITAANSGNFCFHKPSRLSDMEFKLASSFPQDYNFLDNKVQYVVGMAVPPIMMAQVASRIYQYLLS